MKQKYLPLINRTMSFMVVAMAFLLPTMFLPVTTEYYEFNKLAITTALTIVMSILWAAKMLLEGKVEITKSPINIPMLALLGSYGVSTYFSINKVSSIYGSYGRWNSSLVITALTILLYFVVTSNLTTREDIKRVMLGFLYGATVSSLVLVLSFVGIRIFPGSFAQVQNFNLMGSHMLATAMAVLGFLFSLAQLVDNKEKIRAIVFTVCAIINFLPVAITGSAAGWVMLVVSIAAFVTGTANERFKAASRHIAIVIGVALIFGVVFSIPGLKTALHLPADYPKEVKLGLKNSWVVTTSTLRDFPIFGSGPSTFYLNFSHYRPISLNSGETWSVRFDKPYNELLDVTSSLGIAGLLIYLWLFTKVFAMVKHTDTSGTNAALSAGVIGIYSFYMFSHSYAVLNIILFLLLALVTAYIKTIDLSSLASNMLVESAVISFSVSGATTSLTTRTVAVIFALPLLLLSGVASYFGARTYLGEVMMRQAILAAQKDNAQGLFNSQRRAIRLNPYFDTYHASFAQTSYLLANSLAGSKEQSQLTEDDRRNIQALISASIQETRVTTELLNPTNPANWQQRARLYSLLTGVAQDASTWSVASYTRAIELDPTNPLLRLNLGGVYYGLGNFELAERHFRASATLKPDYANAHFNLAQALKQNKKYQESLTEMQIVMRLVPKDGPDYKKAEEELTALRSMPEVAGAITQPSVSELERSGNQGKPGQQTLTNPAEKISPTIKEATESLRP